MTTLSLAIAFGPLSLYFIALAVANSGRRSRVVSGQQDLTALALGLIGFVMIGPMMLFLPVDALGFWGIVTWPMLTVLYALVVVFACSMFPPRLIVYNISLDEIRDALSTLAPELDHESRWCGNSLALPGLGIQFYLEKFPIFRNVSLVATGCGQDVQGWTRFEKSLANTLSRRQTAFNRVWLLLLIPGFGLGLFTTFLLYSNSPVVINVLKEFLVH